MTGHIVIDDVLPSEEFTQIKEAIMHDQFDWQFRKGIKDYKDPACQFVHTFHIQGMQATTQERFSLMYPILNFIQPAGILRIKANLNQKTAEHYETGLHVDVMVPGSLTAIFYINTNNGYTYFEDGQKIESIENRMVMFPSNIPHAGATCTDEDRRVVLNLNYLPFGHDERWQKMMTNDDIQYLETWTERAGEH